MYTPTQVEEVRKFVAENKGEWISEPVIPSLPPVDGGTIMYDMNEIAEIHNLPHRIEEHG